MHVTTRALTRRQDDAGAPRRLRLRAWTQALLAVASCLLLCMVLGACAGKSGQAGTPDQTPAQAQGATSVSEDGTYSSKNEVALYLHQFGHLPSNYISKTTARKAGWKPSKGNLDEVCPGKSIGGGPFYNDDGRLPDALGRSWKECDVNYVAGFRGPERLVYSNDGLVYYTPDHYQSFERLY